MVESVKAGNFIPYPSGSKEGTFMALAMKEEADCVFIDLLPHKHSVLRL